MKVFLSHSTKDKDFVQQLAAAILGAKSEAWLCEIDIEKHENFVAEIEKGLKWCEVALLVWSPDAAASQWTEEEWTSVLARQLRDHPLPELLRTKNYIDARSNPQEALRQTIAWLEHRESVKRFLGLPDYRPQDFVGRTPQLQLLRSTFSGEPMVFLLHGEPGAGKSTLALQFAWDAQKDFDAVVFQTCGRRPLDAITSELVERLPIDVKTLAPDQQRAPPGNGCASENRSWCSTTFGPTATARSTSESWSPAPPAPFSTPRASSRCPVLRPNKSLKSRSSPRPKPMKSLTEVLNALATRRIPLPRASATLYALQQASESLRSPRPLAESHATPFGS